MNKRELAKRHEDFIADLFSGERSASSGASIVDKGDVRIKDDQTLLECKYKGSPGETVKGKSKIVKDMEKIAVEAYEEGRDPALALRYYNPESILANKSSGYVDLVVRLAGDDAYRSERLRDAAQDRQEQAQQEHP